MSTQSSIILYLKVKELHTLYVYIYVFLCSFLRACQYSLVQSAGGVEYTDSISAEE